MTLFKKDLPTLKWANVGIHQQVLTLMAVYIGLCVSQLSISYTVRQDA